MGLAHGGSGVRYKLRSINTKAREFSSFGLKERRFGFDFRKEILPYEGSEALNGFPRAAMAAPGSLEDPKDRLDRAGRTWDSGKCLCPWQGWEGMSFEVPPNPNQAVPSAVK